MLGCASNWMRCCVASSYVLAVHTLVGAGIIHTRKAEEDDNRLSYLATKFLSTGEGAYLNWLRLYDPDKAWDTPNFRRELDSCPNPLYYASLGGIADTANRLVEEGTDVNAQGGYYGNALQAASAEGHDRIVEVLLSKVAVQELGN
ncbi:hypothetical protein V502_00224 [Pseudogymnoascus sp. VKM F-4520 (FW-2644)]|nr:hypothetical protein V502_00224 [Pseudogymnoascus sp. VKM F-4520 (FW-2644)]